MTSSKILADLKIQAMMFDMDIDWGTLTLIPKKVITQTAKYRPDWNLIRRRSAAKKFNIPLNEISDEPDESTDHSEEQGWE